jgi:hypothetical protein
MFELKSGFMYGPADTSLNKDIMSWKEYQVKNRTNSYDLQELYFDLDDVTLMGTSSSPDKMDLTIPRF